MKKFLIFLASCFLLLTSSAFARTNVPLPYELDNGMMFYVIPHGKGNTLYHGIFYNVGSLDDPTGKEGLAHFFEHMMFKGPDGRLVYSLGGDENAYTTYHLTVYHQSFPKEHLRQILKREVRRMEKLPINQTEFDSEKKVILEERSQRYDNNPGALFGERMRAMYFHGHPYQMPVIGYEKTIQNIERTDMDAFFEKHYTPQNAFAVVVGPIEPEQAYKIANETYGKITVKKGMENIRKTAPKMLSALKSGKMVATDPLSKYPGYTVMFSAPSFKEDGYTKVAAFDIVMEYLTGGPESAFQKYFIYEKKTILGVSNGFTPYFPYGGWSSFGFTPAEGIKAEEIFEDMEKLLQRIKKKGMKKERIMTIKKRFHASRIFEQDAPSEQLHTFGYLKVLNMGVDPVSLYRKAYMMVTQEEIEEALNRLIDAPKLKGERLPE